MKRHYFLKIALGLTLLGLLTYFLHKYADNYSWIVILLLFLIVYVFSMWLSEYGTNRMLKLAVTPSVKPGSVICAAFAMFSPFYFFWLLADLIPITSYQVWLITGFPFFFLTMIPLTSVSDFMKDTGMVRIISPKLLLLINLALYIAILIAVQFILNRFIIPAL